MKLLITGSAGFIGSYAVKAAIARGWEVNILDVRSHSSSPRNLDVRLIWRIEADVVLHLAAYSSNAGFADNLAENYANNVFGTWNILRLAQQCGARVVYASSSAVYGSTAQTSANEDWECDTVCLNELQSHYGRSKLINEMMAASFPNTLGLRIFNAYGTGDALKPEGRRAPPTWMQLDKAIGRPMVIYGDGTQAKDFIHVSDVVEIIIRLIESPATGIVNVGTGVSTSFNDLAALIHNVPPEVLKDLPVTDLEYREIPDPASYQFFTRANLTRLLSIIGPYKFKSIEEGLTL